MLTEVSVEFKCTHEMPSLGLTPLAFVLLHVVEKQNSMNLENKRVKVRALLLVSVTVTFTDRSEKVHGHQCLVGRADPIPRAFL